MLYYINKRKGLGQDVSKAGIGALNIVFILAAAVGGWFLLRPKKKPSYTKRSYRRGIAKARPIPR